MFMSHLFLGKGPNENPWGVLGAPCPPVYVLLGIRLEASLLQNIPQFLFYVSVLLGSSVLLDRGTTLIMYCK